MSEADVGTSVSSTRLDEAGHGAAAALAGCSRLDDRCSARLGAYAWQRAVLVSLVAGCAGALIVAPKAAGWFIGAVLAILFAALLLVRLIAIRSVIETWRPSGAAQLVGRDDFPARSFAGALEAAEDEGLPIYSVLVTLYREADVVPALVEALRALDYPVDRLDILFILEADDPQTFRALASLDLPPHMKLVVVPDGQPRTKPRALCHGLALATGDFVVVFDAEDRPEPDQLRLALDAFHRGGPRLGCVQARLNVYNPRDGIVAAQFAVEYTALFDGTMPALAKAGAPLPLGGTSNHFPRRVLDEAGGWDPWNVTEDADLGFRLARRGWSVGVIPSTTWEEAPRDAATWLNQRTRWQKGWMQTYLVHMRDPAQLWVDLGPGRFWWFQLILGGGLLAALAHPWFAGLVVAQVLWGGLAAPQWPPADLTGWVALLALVNFAATVSATVVLSFVTLRARGFKGLWIAALLSPLMWLGVSLAAYRAIFELHRRPFHWAKTPHGLSGSSRTADSSRARMDFSQRIDGRSASQ